jgi:hypothetical protein
MEERVERRESWDISEVYVLSERAETLLLLGRRP